ncbi:MAG TPA: VIT domain-containing protein, partial [Phycisphaerae bacterium]|nr:VIT domain-containing protein [Phycisphaerae bacterium]
MNDNASKQNKGAPRHEIGEQNIERLLSRAYSPEAPEADFAAGVEDRMLRAASERAARRAGRFVPSRRPATAPWKWFFSWPAVAAAAVIIAGLITLTSLTWPPEYRLDGQTVWIDGKPYRLADLGPRTTDQMLRGRAAAVFEQCMVPRRRAEAGPIKPAAVGEVIRTQADQRRRVLLADGSVLYVNENTVARIDGRSAVSLDSGELFVEVAARGADERFTVRTPQRQITAMGTKFAVRARDAGTSVLVTQGKVKVTGLADLLQAGRQLAPAPDGSGERVSPLPRASSELQWTRELMEQSASPMVPVSEYGGGALVAIDPQGQEVKLSLRKFHVDVYVEDGFTRTTIDQTYFNHENRRLEGTFYFPLPPDASLSRLAMYVNGKLMEGGMAERDYARSVYESIVYRQKDPALLEWVDGSTFKMRVFPLEARQEKRIVLSYTQRVADDYGKAEIRFPAGHNMKLVREWSFRARVRNGAEKGPAPMMWNCSSHDLTARTEGEDLVLEAGLKNVTPDKDVVLEIEDASGGGASGAARFAGCVHESYRYLMLRCRPALGVPPQRQRRDWVFLYESGGDRDPLLGRVQIDVIGTILDNAEHDDRFAILTAGTRTSLVTNGFEAATPQNVAEAVRLLEKTHLVGALDLEQAFGAAGRLLADSQAGHLVHVGSGTPILGQRKQDVLVGMIPNGTKYVGVGVGKRWNRALMKAAAARTGGYYTQINPDENVTWRAFELVSTLNTPRLMNVKVADPAGGLEFLCCEDAVADGEEICAIARVHRTAERPAQVIVSGMLDGAPYSQSLRVEKLDRDDADCLPRIWAKLEIDRLLAAGAEKNKAKIVELSKAMYVMSPFTSLLVLENEQMYKQFKIDRGRKDHWALYPCPEKIPVVHEPLARAGAPDANSPAKTGKPGVPAVLQTVLVRIPPPVLRWPNWNGQYYPVLTAWQVLTGAYAIPVDVTGLVVLRSTFSMRGGGWDWNGDASADVDWYRLDGGFRHGARLGGPMSMGGNGRFFDDSSITWETTITRPLDLPVTAAEPGPPPATPPPSRQPTDPMASVEWQLEGLRRRRGQAMNARMPFMPWGRKGAKLKSSWGGFEAYSYSFAWGDIKKDLSPGRWTDFASKDLGRLAFGASGLRRDLGGGDLDWLAESDR